MCMCAKLVYVRMCMFAHLGTEMHHRCERTCVCVSMHNLCAEVPYLCTYTCGRVRTYAPVFTYEYSYMCTYACVYVHLGMDIQPKHRALRHV
jgi:hypothetical protein